ncbi:membrane protein [Klebsiella pneumoniae]|uniref:Membrane protein n=1 Tax=Klebsiella pneumoniae TaxID=573 RepID=A0A377UYM7_KLEPN|nr:membrane protein [Klebsiella pneumoniae]
MVRAKLKFRLHRAVIVLICLALLVALMQGASWFSQNSQKQRNPQLEELARTPGAAGGAESRAADAQRDA